MTFDYHWNKRRKKFPDEPEYISLCFVLEGSGAEAEEIYELFDEYMPSDDFFLNEREEMCAYLIFIAEDYYERNHNTKI